LCISCSKYKFHRLVYNLANNWLLVLSSLASFKRSVDWCISSKNGKEMSTKSYMVCKLIMLFHLVFCFYESKIDEVCSIMKGLQKYVPSITLSSAVRKWIFHQWKCYHWTLFGGHQLTVCQSHGAQSVWCVDDDSDEWFDKLVPVMEDWHARMVLMSVSRQSIKLGELKKATLDSRGIFPQEISVKFYS